MTAIVRPPVRTRGNVGIALAITWMAVIVVAGLAGATILGQTSLDQDIPNRLMPPGLGNGWEYVLGTDALGRPYLSRIAAAAGPSLVVMVSVVFFATLVGGALGTIAGYKQGLIGGLIVRYADVTAAFPSILFAIVVLYVFDSTSLAVLIGILAFTRLPIYIRAANAEAMKIRSRPYIRAAELSGLSTRQILLGHVRLMVSPMIWVVATMDAGAVLLAESGLSFLGIGVQPPAASWGLLVADGQVYLRSAWWLAVIPGVVIVLTTLSLRTLARRESAYRKRA